MSARRPIAAEDLLRLQWVNDPQWHPLDGSVTFVRTSIHPDTWELPSACVLGARRPHRAAHGWTVV